MANTEKADPSLVKPGTSSSHGAIEWVSRGSLIGLTVSYAAVVCAVAQRVWKGTGDLDWKLVLVLMSPAIVAVLALFRNVRIQANATGANVNLSQDAVAPDPTPNTKTNPKPRSKPKTRVPAGDKRG